jgi:hypothetical protein
LRYRKIILNEKSKYSLITVEPRTLAISVEFVIIVRKEWLIPSMICSNLEMKPYFLLEGIM